MNTPKAKYWLKQKAYELRRFSTSQAYLSLSEIARDVAYQQKLVSLNNREVAMYGQVFRPGQVCTGESKALRKAHNRRIQDENAMRNTAAKAAKVLRDVAFRTMKETYIARVGDPSTPPLSSEDHDYLERLELAPLIQQREWFQREREKEDERLRGLMAKEFAGGKWIGNRPGRFDVQIRHVQTLPRAERKFYYWQFYLRSDHWLLLRHEKLLANSLCEVCWATARDVHHLIYRSFFDVSCSDLRSVCRVCHDCIHTALKEKRLVYRFNDDHTARWKKTLSVIGRRDWRGRELNVVEFGH